MPRTAFNVVTHSRLEDYVLGVGFSDIFILRDGDGAEVGSLFTSVSNSNHP